MLSGRSRWSIRSSPQVGGTLGLDRLDRLVGLDVGDSRVLREPGGLLLGQLDREALERVLEDLLEAAAVRARDLSGEQRDERPLRAGFRGGAGGIGVQDDDVAAADGVLGGRGAARGGGNGEDHADRGDDA